MEMEIDIDKATLQDIISLILEGKTDKEIAAMKDYKSNSAVYTRLTAVGADKSSGKWDFTNVYQSFMEQNFWRLPTEKDSQRETGLEKSTFSEKEVITLKKIIGDYISRSENKETEALTYEKYGKLLFEHASYKNKDNTTKQLNVPVPDTVMQRLDEFINTSGLEKKFIVKKALEVFLDLYEGGLPKE